MYYLFSIITGLIITVMVVFNGQLTNFYGVYLSTVIIHLIGFISISIICTIKKVKIINHKVSILLYIGGAIGVATILFNNLSFGKISVTAINGLGLLGQALTSIVIDQFGLFEMPKNKFEKKKCISFVFLLLGVTVMFTTFTSIMVVPIILSLLTGVTIVTSRTINANLAQKTSILTSTWYNYFIGFIISLIVLLICNDNSNLLSSFKLSSNIYIYLGGTLGVIAVFLSNIIVTKISSFYMTLLLFIGQVFSGIVLDIILTSQFSTINLIGGILVTIGLTINVLMDKKKLQTNK